MFFNETWQGGEAALALFSRHLLSGMPHPSWLKQFDKLRIDYNFFYFMFYMTSLPEGIRPEVIVARKFFFFGFFCYILLMKSNKTET
jgi:hypothetical protein